MSGPPSRKQAQTASFLVHQRIGMQSLRVNGYDMAYLDVGQGPPLVSVHGSLCDFCVWSPVLGPLTTRHRVIAVSLRHFFPEHWDGSGDTYSLAQHVEDMIVFIDQLTPSPVDLMGHSRGGHIAFRVAQHRQLRDNVFTLLGQVGENRKPFGEADAQAIRAPTLFIGGSETKGSLPLVLRALSAKVAGARVAMIEGAGHWMFEQAPQRYAEIVMEFLTG